MRDLEYSDLKGRNLVFGKYGRLDEMISYERCSHMEGRLYLAHSGIVVVVVVVVCCCYCCMLTNHSHSLAFCGR